jgi:hypothetical protein
MREVDVLGALAVFVAIQRMTRAGKRPTDGSGRADQRLRTSISA